MEELASQGVIWGLTSLLHPNSSRLWRNYISKSHAGVHQNNLKRSPLPNSFPCHSISLALLSPPLLSSASPHTFQTPIPTLSASPLNVFQPSGMSESNAAVNPRDSLSACLSIPGWKAGQLMLSLQSFGILPVLRDLEGFSTPSSLPTDWVEKDPKAICARFDNIHQARLLWPISCTKGERRLHLKFPFAPAVLRIISLQRRCEKHSDKGTVHTLEASRTRRLWSAGGLIPALRELSVLIFALLPCRSKSNLSKNRLTAFSPRKGAVESKPGMEECEEHPAKLLVFLGIGFPLP